MPANLHPITRTILSLTALLPLSVIAQPVTGSNHTNTPAQVEVGPGGEIKPESEYRTEAESTYKWHAHFLWESRYITQGRDNLAGKNLISASSEFTLGKLAIVPWLATDPGTDYTELDLNIVYGIELEKGFSAYAGYTNIQSRDNGISSNDNELSFELAYEITNHVSLLTSLYHSFDASGTFLEVATRFDHPFDNNLHFSAQGIIGVNSGYITDGHHGLNYFQLHSTIAYRPVTQIEVYAYISHSQAINRDALQYAGDAALDNFLWGGAGFSYLFK